MDLVAKIDGYGKGAWIGLMVLSFILFWPIGLAMLVFLIWSGRMKSWKNFACGGHHFESRGKWYGPSRGSGNRAFDEYREQTLKRLDEERQEFMDYLDRLRHARDKEEFDRFMAERANKQRESTPPEAPQQA